MAGWGWVALGGALAIGVAELGVTVLAGYFGYRMFAYGESFTEALKRTVPADQR